MKSIKIYKSNPDLQEYDFVIENNDIKKVRDSVDEKEKSDYLKPEIKAVTENFNTFQNSPIEEIIL